MKPHTRTTVTMHERLLYTHDSALRSRPLQRCRILQSISSDSPLTMVD